MQTVVCRGLRCKPGLLYSLCFVLSLYLLVGCSAHQTQVVPPVKGITLEQAELLKVHQEWQGTPYRLGGDSKSGIDCSAFVQQLYISAYHKQLPRTTEAQMRQGKAIRLTEAKTGDLIFFKTSRKVRHVGVIYDQQYFLHASTSKGVIFSRLDNVYWSPKIIAINRPSL